MNNLLKRCLNFNYFYEFSDDNNKYSKFLTEHILLKQELSKLTGEELENLKAKMLLDLKDISEVETKISFLTNK